MAFAAESLYDIESIGLRGEEIWLLYRDVHHMDSGYSPKTKYRRLRHSRDHASLGTIAATRASKSEVELVSLIHNGEVASGHSGTPALLSPSTRTSA